MRQTALPDYLKKGMYLSFRWFPKSPRMLKQTQHNIIQRQSTQGKTQDEKDHHMIARTSLEAETKSWAPCLTKVLEIKSKSSFWNKEPYLCQAAIRRTQRYFHQSQEGPRTRARGWEQALKWSHKGEGCPCQKGSMIKPPKTIRMSVLNTKLVMTQNTGQTWKEEPNCSPVNFLNKSWLTTRLTDHSWLQ